MRDFTERDFFIIKGNSSADLIFYLILFDFYEKISFCFNAIGYDNTGCRWFVYFNSDPGFFNEMMNTIEAERIFGIIIKGYHDAARFFQVSSNFSDNSQ